MLFYIYLSLFLVDTHEKHGVSVKHDSSKDDRTVFLSNLAYQTDEEKIREFASPVCKYCLLISSVEKNIYVSITSIEKAQPFFFSEDTLASYCLKTFLTAKIYE